MNKLPSEAGDYIFMTTDGRLGHLIIDGVAPYLGVERCYVLANLNKSTELKSISDIEKILYKITGTQIAPVQ